MHKGHNCKTCEIPTGVKYLIQCSVCSSNGKWRLFSSESGRGGEWQWPGSGTMRSPPSPYGIAALSTGILMWRWRRLKVQVFIHELLVRCRLFGVMAFFLRLTPISIHFLCFCHEDIGGWGGSLLFGRRQCGPLPSPLAWAAQWAPGKPSRKEAGLNCFEYWSWPERKMPSFLTRLLLKFIFSGCFSLLDCDNLVSPG